MAGGTGGTDGRHDTTKRSEVNNQNGNAMEYESNEITNNAARKLHRRSIWIVPPKLLPTRMPCSTGTPET